MATFWGFFAKIFSSQRLGLASVSQAFIAVFSLSSSSMQINGETQLLTQCQLKWKTPCTIPIFVRFLCFPRTRIPMDWIWPITVLCRGGTSYTDFTGIVVFFSRSVSQTTQLKTFLPELLTDKCTRNKRSVICLHRQKCRIHRLYIKHASTQLARQHQRIYTVSLRQESIGLPGASLGETMWGGHMATGVWGGAPSWVQGQSPWSGVKPPPEAETLLGFGDQRKHQICFILRILQTPLLVIIHEGEGSSKPWLTPPLLLSEKKSPDLHYSQEWPLAKVGWTCPPQSTPWRRPWGLRILYIL